ncbi:putative Haloacid dehalogenase-like hydrolase [Taphrina deformans PYCC 5710]|uniref:Haloacid dehalogenase-like hydrolase n=1 Tax=Taphrina deformans (strain PYCC 5710 / ATCC 11124 / CBS 356.35 / IMI 108563 / JCM 9778 / NBRC 8474) TaxID=1097556 RepID=R4XCE7_TAPDE|nr:putative Haloacid dehalogenase-like hydrolase [Taphrina deformans PYCC 5710]|eukprot:CCG83542.1 putative Haloacid dehalogenase-like hydrolase [Taphrina deformans PYCC 5710]
MSKSACFDVIGTCFGFDGAIECIDKRIGAKLKSVNVDAKSFFFSWFYAAQRDFTYNSMVDNYVPIAQILSKTLKRACEIVDLPGDQVSDDDVLAVMNAFKNLDAREGLKACFDGLKEHGWDVYGVTNGGAETSLAYYSKADITLANDHIISCDTIQKAKPDIRVYENAKELIKKAGCSEEQQWFVAAHSWDLIAARKAGYKTAYLDIEEHDPVTEVFGTFDLYASSFEQLLERMKAL